MSEHQPVYAVSLSGLRHRYGKLLALDVPQLAIPAGCMAGFIGPDGVGKSTLLALIAGAARIQRGRILTLDADMAEASQRRALCQRVAYMPQGLGRNLYPTLSVLENIDFFGRLYGHRQRSAHIEELLSATGLAAFADRAAGKLSGGMKQKLGLCCALVHEPDLLILDEPTTGVDPLSRRQFWALIARIRLRRPGISVLVASAYIEEAERFDTLVAMNDGKVLATGSPAALMQASMSEHLEQAFIALLPAASSPHAPAIPPPMARVAADAEIAIEARNLSCRFGDFVAVDRVSFQIRRGEIFGFLGSNGCGKTTTMKMLTGLLPVTEGEAALFGRRIDSRELATRARVGYMSQGFSLYTELTVRQNLLLHARLFHLPAAAITDRVPEMLARFGLSPYAAQRPDSLPLGIRQRLSLAVALIHAPEMLILDEPTSGVDPVARNSFWQLLTDLARVDGVTIFISTHFMNEAERCDRLSLMHAGRVLAQGTPQEIRGDHATLEDAFIASLEAAGGIGPALPVAAVTSQAPQPSSWLRLWAYAVREALEVRRDPIRLAFALLGPVLLMVVFGYGISFDVEKLSYAALDHDRSPASRRYLDNFAGSRYFLQQAALQDHAEMERRLRSGRLKVALEIAPGFGFDLAHGRIPQVGVWVDGADPERAATSLGYVAGAHQHFLDELYRSDPALAPPPPPAHIAVRFLYNQDFRSVYSVVPSVLMLLLIFIPSMMTALAVVRERELGSITNLYVTPVTGTEFLLGKQLPYVVLGYINFLTMLALAYWLFHVPVKGSLGALTLGAALYVIATTGFGLLVSTFVKTQVAAIFAAGILSTLPAIQFSGMFTPVSSLSGSAREMARIFPSTYFQHVSMGSMTKALGWRDLGLSLLALAACALVLLLLARALLRTQAR
jgi:ribosome-dependent ATPase